MFSAAAASTENYSWIAPTIGGIFAVITGILAGRFARNNLKNGNIEQRAPDVQEMWSQQESDRRARQVMEDLWWDLRSAFKSYFRRVSNAVMTLDLTVEQAKQFELTDSEKNAINAEVPEDPSPTVKGK